MNCVILCNDFDFNFLTEIREKKLAFFAHEKFISFSIALHDYYLSDTTHIICQYHSRSRIRINEFLCQVANGAHSVKWSNHLKLFEGSAQIKFPTFGFEACNKLTMKKFILYSNDHGIWTDLFEISLILSVVIWLILFFFFIFYSVEFVLSTL